MHLIMQWPNPIYMRVGYVFESRFSARTIWPISMIFGIGNKKWWNFKKVLLKLGKNLSEDFEIIDTFCTRKWK